jgi:5-histidylcysteine sulfoxide synthase
MDANQLLSAVKTINLNVGSCAQSKRIEIYEAFKNHYELYESLFSIVKDEAHFVRADRLRHPLIFYLGHTAAFYVNKLVLSNVLREEERVDPVIEDLVAVGVDEMSWDDLLPDGFPWPSVPKMKEFRNTVKELVTDVILNRIDLQANAVIGWDHPFWAIIMGIEHERIHLETTAVLIRQLPLHHLQKPQNAHILSNVCPNWRSRIEDVPEIRFVEVQGGDVYLGRSLGENQWNVLDKENGKSSVYGWDNEYGFHHSNVNSFKATNFIVSNAEWLKFMDDGGYENQKYWSEEGWGWVQFIKPEHPLFWIKSGDSYVLRHLFSVSESMPWDWPVEVNALEANAYCRWFSEKSGSYTRLPTEDEWNLLLKRNSPYKTSGSDDVDEFLPQNVNIAFQKYASTTPIDAYRTGNYYDVCGNVWQWTKTPTYPFEKFDVHPIYLDFTTPTYDDKHNIIKGGSWITTGNEATRYSRYAFRRHFFQFAGFRMVQPLNESAPEFEPEYEPKNVFQ